MANDSDAPTKTRQNRPGTDVRFGRHANPVTKPRRLKLRYIVAPLIIVALAVSMVAFRPAQPSRGNFLHNWLAERQEVQRQKELEANLRQIEKFKREMDALRERSKAESEAARKKMDNLMPWMQQAAPHPQDADKPKASVETKESVPPVQEHRSPAGHKDAVVWLSVSPDGKRLLSASTDKSVKLWNVGTGLLERDVGQHGDMVRTALFLSGGAEVMSGADDGQIAIWSVENDKAKRVLTAESHGGVRSLAVSGDGRLAVSGHQSGAVMVWDLMLLEMRHVLTGHQWPANAVAVLDDSSLVASGDIDGVIRTWDLQTGKLLRMWKGHERGIYGARFLPGEHQLITASGDGLLKQWNVDTGQLVRSFSGHAGTVYSVAISADGKRMLSGSLDGTARLWDLATGEELRLFDKPGKRIYSVALLDDGSEAIGDDSGRIDIMADKGGAVRTLAVKASR